MASWYFSRTAGFKWSRGKSACELNHSIKPGIGDSVQKVFSEGNSFFKLSATRLIKKFPIETPRKPG